MKELVGVGTDIEQVRRFKNNPYFQNKLFYQKIFSAEEIEHCLKKPCPEQSFAARFAAKEAIIKGLNPLKIWYSDIVIKNNHLHSPYVLLNNHSFQNFKIKISLSHTDDYAIAFAMVMKC